MIFFFGVDFVSLSLSLHICTTHTNVYVCVYILYSWVHTLILLFSLFLSLSLSLFLKLEESFSAIVVRESEDMIGASVVLPDGKVAQCHLKNAGWTFSLSDETEVGVGDKVTAIRRDDIRAGYAVQVAKTVLMKNVLMMKMAAQHPELFCLRKDEMAFGGGEKETLGEESDGQGEIDAHAGTKKSNISESQAEAMEEKELQVKEMAADKKTDTVVKAVEGDEEKEEQVLGSETRKMKGRQLASPPAKTRRVDP